MEYLDEWHDYFRLAIFFLSLWCAVVLVLKKQANSDTWNVKTLDYWYSLFMWSIVGIVSSMQGIVTDRPLTPAFIACSAAVMVTGKGLHKKGSWGGDS